MSLAVGIYVPADSTPQQGLGQETLTDNTLTQNPLHRGDLDFLARRAASMMRDSQTLLHANAHHMRTVAEPLAQVITRIKADTNGAIIARRRLAKD